MNGVAWSRRDRRRAAFAVALALTGAATGCGRDAPEPQRPHNLVLISLDTLRADRLGLYGHERDTSPRLDRWAEDAIVFTRALSPSNETIAAHHSIFQSELPVTAMTPGRRQTLAAMLQRRGYRTVAFTDGGPMSPKFAFGAGFQGFDSANGGLRHVLPRALAWIDLAAAQPEPFYAFIHTFDIHLPYDPPPPYDTMFYADYAGEVTGAETRSLMRRVRGIFEWENNTDPFDIAEDDRRKIDALYDGGIAYADDQLQLLLDRLDRDDLRDETMVVIFSDHGEEFWDHGSVLHAHTLYQEILHVPFLVRLPGIAGRSVVERVSLIDTVPTIMEALEHPVAPALKGASLMPLIRGEEVAERAIVSQGVVAGTKLQSVVSGSFKLIRSDHLEGQPFELYDLDRDPHELEDLSERLPDVAVRLSAMLDRVLAAVDDGVEHPFDRLPEDLDEETLERLRSLGYVD